MTTFTVEIPTNYNEFLQIPSEFPSQESISSILKIQQAIPKLLSRNYDNEELYTEIKDTTDFPQNLLPLTDNDAIPKLIYYFLLIKGLCVNGYFIAMICTTIKNRIKTFPDSIINLTQQVINAAIVIHTKKLIELTYRPDDRFNSVVKSPKHIIAEFNALRLCFYEVFLIFPEIKLSNWIKKRLLYNIRLLARIELVIKSNSYIEFKELVSSQLNDLERLSIETENFWTRTKNFGSNNLTLIRQDNIPFNIFWYIVLLTTESQASYNRMEAIYRQYHQYRNNLS